MPIRNGPLLGPLKFAEIGRCCQCKVQYVGEAEERYNAVDSLMTAPIHENLGRFVWTLVPRQTDPFVNVQSELTFGLGRLAGWASPYRVKRRRMKMVRT